MIYCGFATRCGYITKLTFIKSCQNLGKTPLLGLHSPSESHLRMLRRAIAGRSLCNGTWLRRLRGAGRPWPHQQLSTAAEHSFSSEKMAWVSLSDGLSSGDLSLRLENHHGESTTMVASLCPRLLRKKNTKTSIIWETQCHKPTILYVCGWFIPLTHGDFGDGHGPPKPRLTQLELGSASRP
jgi:hypothetical protein